jgi:hypothetical protein
VVRRDVGVDGQLASRVQAAHGADEAFDRGKHAASQSRRGTRGCGRARAGEVIVDLPLHPLHQLPERRRQLVMPLGRRLLRLLRQHRQRRLQSVREIAGGGQGSGHGARAILEQRVQVVHQRLHLARIVALQSLTASLAHRREAGAQTSKRGQRPLHEKHSAGDERQGGDDHDDVRHVTRRDLGMVARQPDHRGDDRDQHGHHPDDGAGHEAGPERALHSLPMRYPSPRTVSIIEAPSFRRSRAMNTSTVFESRSKVCA